jgi:ABC-type bacteriocin/lantibiotic exporter with double-glycine peptidase domain
MAFFLFFMRGAGITTRLVNGACCVNVRHMTRVGIATLITFLSFALIATACIFENQPIFFWVAVAASVLQGVA